MKHALLFRDTQEPILVSADEVKAGRYNRHDEYVDPEYEFKVEYVNAAKNGGGPYFRLYYSYEEYKSLYPERADRYQFVANMRRYEESAWHTHWKANVADFCRIEYTIPNKKIQRWKIADAYYADTKTCIEFQHSYISFHFEEKNEFYRSLSLQAIWLYDLSCSNIRLCVDGSIEILENNSRGFFRISENANNLRDNFVYIQVKSGNIYRVTELHRRESSNNLKSTIRYFMPSEIYKEHEFVTAIQANSFKSYEDILSERETEELQRQEREVNRLKLLQEEKRRLQAQKHDQAQNQQVLVAEISVPPKEIEHQQEQHVLRQQDAKKTALEDEAKAADDANHKHEDAIRQEMQLANYEQSNDVLDCDGRKWVLCKFCKKAVLFNTEVSTYSPGSNKATCKNCRFRM